MNTTDEVRRDAIPTWRVESHGERPSPIEREWLLTNGAGGYAMGTAMGCNTRRYHGLLVAAARPPVERRVTVNAVNEAITLDGRRIELANHEFAGDQANVFHPQGWHHLQTFEKDLQARWTYRIGPVEMVKRLRLIWKRQVAVVSYTIELPSDTREYTADRVTLELAPLLAMRDFHGLRNAFEHEFEQRAADERTLSIAVGEGEGETLHMACDAGRWEAAPDWWHNFFYRRDAERQMEAVESLHAPGRFEVVLSPDRATTVTLAFGLEAIDWSTIRTPDARPAHLAPIIEQAQGRLTPAHHARCAALAIASDDFVVDRRVDGKGSTTIIAGYPWFSDWGRDTMIALPGCLLATGRFDEARSTLTTFAAHIADGLIPNRFDDYGGDPHYNTVDASLWFVQAALAYMDATGDDRAWGEGLEDACMAIVDAYAAGTRYGIGMTDDGLIAAGSPQTQLTWMDAARDGVVFTPRWGKAVEINALWHHALTGLSQRTPAAMATRYADLAQRAKRSFARLFWDEQAGYLVDHVNDHGVDRSLRPNQALAVSLPGELISATRAKRIMTTLRDRLLTPRGMRTLPPDDPAYHGRYEGAMFERDEAYHQGTVWAWLIGPFIEGWLRAHNFSQRSRREAQQYIDPLLEQLDGESLGQLHEIFDADPPHRPRGCIAQAWSVSELLRAQQLIDG